MSKLQVGRVFLSPTFSKKKLLRKTFEVGRSDMDVHTYYISMVSPKYGDDRDVMALVWNFFFEVIPKESLDFKASLNLILTPTYSMSFGQ